MQRVNDFHPHQHKIFAKAELEFSGMRKCVRRDERPPVHLSTDAAYPRDGSGRPVARAGERFIRLLAHAKAPVDLLDDR